MRSTLNLDYLASEGNKVWLGDCKITNQSVSFCYGYFKKFAQDTVWVYREDGKGYLLDIPAELRMQPQDINFFRQIEIKILDVTTKATLDVLV